MYLLRSFSLSKWSPNLVKSLNDFETDPITGCTRTQSNELSVWKIDSFCWDSDLINKIITAFAINKDAPATLDFIFLDGGFLTSKGIEIENKEAETPYEQMNSYHHDLTKLTYEKLGTVADHIVTQLNDRETHKRIEKAILIKLVVDIYLKEGQEAFDLDSLSEKWVKAIKSEITKRGLKQIP